MDKEITQGLTKLKNAQAQNTRVIKTSLTKLNEDLQHSQSLDQTQKIAKEKHESITTQLKNYHANISKYTKVIDKVYLWLLALILIIFYQIGDSHLDLWSQIFVNIYCSNTVITSSPPFRSTNDPYLSFASEYLCRLACKNSVECLERNGTHSLVLYFINPFYLKESIECHLKKECILRLFILF